MTYNPYLSIGFVKGAIYAFKERNLINEELHGSLDMELDDLFEHVQELEAKAANRNGVYYIPNNGVTLTSYEDDGK